MSAVRMTLTELVASADSWPDGVAPERPLLAYLSGLSQPALEHCLQRALLAAIVLVTPDLADDKDAWTAVERALDERSSDALVLPVLVRSLAGADPKTLEAILTPMIRALIEP